MSWVDGVLLLFIALGVWQGFLQGFMLILFQFASLILATLVTFWSLPRVSAWAERQIQVPISFAQPLSLAILFLLTSTVFGAVANLLHKLLAPILRASMVNRFVGMILGGLRSALIAGVVLTFLITLPLPTSVKSAMNNSILSRPLIQGTLAVEQWFEKRFDKGNLDSIAFRTIGKDESTTTALNFTDPNAPIDQVGEETLFTLTNQIRQKQGVPALNQNTTLRDVARAHAKDMLTRGYFSHFSPQGDDAAKRVQKAGITAVLVGENLANAPTVLLAQAGLLASPGHRDNILNPKFNQVGIGILDAGIHGKMIVEVFAQTP